MFVSGSFTMENILDLKNKLNPFSKNKNAYFNFLITEKIASLSVLCFTGCACKDIPTKETPIDWGIKSILPVDEFDYEDTFFFTSCALGTLMIAVVAAKYLMKKSDSSESDFDPADYELVHFHPSSADQAREMILECDKSSPLYKYLNDILNEKKNWDFYCRIFRHTYSNQYVSTFSNPISLLQRYFELVNDRNFNKEIYNFLTPYFKGAPQDKVEDQDAASLPPVSPEEEHQEQNPLSQSELGSPSQSSPEEAPVVATYQNKLPSQTEAWNLLKSCQEGSHLYLHWNAILSNQNNEGFYILLHTSVLPDAAIQRYLNPVALLQEYLKNPKHKHINNYITETLTLYFIHQNAVNICADGHCMFGSLIHEILKNKDALKESNIWDNVKKYLNADTRALTAEDFKSLDPDYRLDIAKNFRDELYMKIITETSDTGSSSYTKWETQLSNDDLLLTNQIQDELFSIANHLNTLLTPELQNMIQQSTNPADTLSQIIAKMDQELDKHDEDIDIYTHLNANIEILLQIKNIKEAQVSSSPLALREYCRSMLSNRDAGILDQKLISILTGLSIKTVQHQQQKNQHQVYILEGKRQSPHLTLYRTGDNNSGHYQALNLDLTGYEDLDVITLTDC